MAEYDEITKLKETRWKGYERHDFLYEGRDAIVVGSSQISVVN